MHDRLYAEASRSLWRLEEQVSTKTSPSYHTAPVATARVVEMKTYMVKVKASLQQWGLGTISMPRYFRKLLNSRFGSAESFNSNSQEYLSYKRMIGHLMKSNLTLSRDAVPGEGNFANFFLCADVRDEDFPWDLKDPEAGW